MSDPDIWSSVGREAYKQKGVCPMNTLFTCFLPVLNMFFRFLITAWKTYMMKEIGIPDDKDRGESRDADRGCNAFISYNGAVI